MTDNQNKVDEMLRFLEFSFHNETDKFTILFELFVDNIDEITRTISILIDGPKLIISNIKFLKYDSEIKLKEQTFIDLYSGNLSAFQLFKLLFKSNDIKTTNVSINKFRRFVSKFDFSEKSWQ